MDPTRRRITSALFVDYDNAYSTLRSLDQRLADAFAHNGVTWLEGLREGSDEEGPFTRRFLQRSAYLNPSVYGQHRSWLTNAGFRVVDCPSLTRAGKSSADIWMALDIVDALAHPTRFEEFVIISSDADFTPILHRIRTFDRKASIIATGIAAAAYRATADHVIDAGQFARFLGVESDDSHEVPMPVAAPLGLAEELPSSDEESEVPSTDEYPDLAAAASKEARRLAAAQAVADLVINASGPVPAAAAAAAAKAVDPSLPADKWDGLGFIGWAEANLVGVGCQRYPSSGFVWDSSRFDAPNDSDPLSPLQRQVASLTDVPRLSEQQFAALHGALAATIAKSGTLSITTSPAAVRALLTTTYPPVSLRAVKAVISVILVSTGGEVAGAATPKQIAQLWSDIVVGMAEAARVDLDDGNRAELRKWLGGGLLEG